MLAGEAVSMNRAQPLAQACKRTPLALTHLSLVALHESTHAGAALAITRLPRHRELLLMSVCPAPMVPNAPEALCWYPVT
jgi:hypothetical protein